MLILTRKIGEKITIGDEITITVLSIQGRQARFGVDAPKHIAVHRHEVYDRIHHNKNITSETSASDTASEVDHD